MIARKLALVLSVGIGTALVSGAGVQILGKWYAQHTAKPSMPLSTLYGIDRYRVATASLSGGTLSSSLQQRLQSLGNAELTFVIVLRARDLETCEDLGRQLRQLVHELNGSDRVVITGEEKDARRVETFLASERLNNVSVVALPVTATFEDDRPIGTPAALVVDERGRVLEGVSHPLRYPNARVRSFADELKTARERSKQVTRKKT